jgi:hypothetical protein
MRRNFESLSFRFRSRCFRTATAWKIVRNKKVLLPSESSKESLALPFGTVAPQSPARASILQNEKWYLFDQEVKIFRQFRCET